MTQNKFNIADVLIYAGVGLLAISILLPFVNMMAISFSPSYVATKGGLHLWPEDFTTDNYYKVFINKFIWSGYKNTIIRTLITTPATVLVTAFAAYPLAKKFFPHRSFWTFIIVFTMFFSGGLIPNYLLVKDLGMMNTLAAIIVPGLTGAYVIVIMRNFFQSLPEEIEESCMIDGAGRWRIFFQIVIPLSTPIIATISLWTAVATWNEWFSVLLYIQDVDKFVLQIVLRRIIIVGTQEIMDTSTGGTFLVEETLASPEGLKAAATFVAIFPILCTYPFIQRYFVKGIMIGSLKG
ncbi:MAG: carbohydrate ABC transporter permease [Clostridiales bacterium]|nr:carbohydrate ABC transporter permease [Clostridiales bacterium]